MNQHYNGAKYILANVNPGEISRTTYSIDPARIENLTKDGTGE
ncbi:hypothetical protein EYZ11_006354 [Aspergillus tanneri]|uniref:Uncharacterized protein n=1 Tax=Aspergillus tanneri TaxID=1220188 RepID=A0A4S3JFK9_9EURO|nr:hypothetical protein EYZ11_006354 [Aspergillus tanneri]